MNTEISKNTNPTPQEVEQWEKDYGKLKKVSVSDSENTHIFYFKEKYTSKRQTLALANRKLMETKDLFQYAEIVLKNAIVNGWDIIQKEDDIFVALSQKVDAINSNYVATLGE